MDTRKNKRIAPGRRIILLRADSKEEALTAVQLMYTQLKNIPDENDIIQSLYIDDKKNGSGSVWFG